MGLQMEIFTCVEAPINLYFIQNKYRKVMAIFSNPILFGDIPILLVMAISRTQERNIQAITVWDIINICFQIMLLFKTPFCLDSTGVLALTILDLE